MRYIALPLFSEGAVDPVPQRSGKHDAGTDRDTVSVFDLLETRTQATLSKPRHVRQDRVVESQDIIRDPSTGLVVEGREQLLFELSDEVIIELVKGAPNREAPTAQEIADRLWVSFNEETNTSDNKWTEVDVKKKAGERHQRLEKGDFKFTDKAKTNTLLPTEQSHFDLDLSLKEKDQRRLESTLKGFFRAIKEGSTPR
jgi:hypothetical protein